MNKYKIIISPFAELDLIISKEWYDLQGEGLSSKFIGEVEKTILRIQSNPLMFCKVKKQVRMAIVERFPFGVYYFIKDEIINILAVFHFSRNPKTLKRRVK